MKLMTYFNMKGIVLLRKLNVVIQILCAWRAKCGVKEERNYTSSLKLMMDLKKASD